MDTLIDLLVLLSPAVIGLLCIAATALAPMYQNRRRGDRRGDPPLSSAD